MTTIYFTSFEISFLYNWVHLHTYAYFLEYWQQNFKIKAFYLYCQTFLGERLSQYELDTVWGLIFSYPISYYTYRSLLGEKQHLIDLICIFLYIVVISMPTFVKFLFFILLLNFIYSVLGHSERLSLFTVKSLVFFFPSLIRLLFGLEIQFSSILLNTFIFNSFFLH